MARFKENKSVNPKLNQDKIAKELGGSSSTLQRSRRDINMLSPYKFPASSYNTRQKKSNDDDDLKRRRMTRMMSLKDLKQLFRLNLKLF